MATLEQVEQALRAADAAGDTEAATMLAQEYRRMSAAPSAEPAPSGAPSIRDALVRAIGTVASPLSGLRDRAVEDVKDMGVGIAHGFAHMATGLDKAASKRGMYSAPPQSTAAIDAAYDDAGAIAGVGNVLPELVATGGPIGGAGKLLGKGAARVLPKALAKLAPAIGDIAANSAYEAGKAAVNGEDVGRAAMLGGAGAAGGRVLVRTLGGVAKPFVSKDAQTLMDEGITPTPGQLFGDGPIGSGVRSLEDKATSLPLAGEMIAGARRRSMGEFGKAELNNALKPIGGRVDNAGREAVEQADDLISKVYEKVIPQIYVDPRVAAPTIAKIPAQVARDPMLNAEGLATIDRHIATMNRAINEARAAGRPISGEVAKDIDTAMGQNMRKLLKADDAYQNATGEAVSVLRDAWRNSFQGTTPGAREALQAANRAYANMVPIRKAADRAAARGGMFTPNQLDRAMRDTGRKTSDLTRAAQGALPSTVPDSGSAGRLLMGMGTFGTGATVDLGTTAGLTVATGALYTKYGTRLLTEGLGVAPGVAASLAKLPERDVISYLTQQAMNSPQLAAQLARLYSAEQGGQGDAQ